MIASAVAKLDAWRQPVAGAASADGAYKEWMHFCVRLPGAQHGYLLVNLNVSESKVGGLGGRVLRTPRLLALARLERWAGSVETFAEQDAVCAPGRLDVKLGRNALRWRDGAFHLSLAPAAGPAGAGGDVAAAIALRPLVMPTVTSTVSLGPGGVIHWVVIPRLEASGWVQVGGRRVTLDRALAYHDHNWGTFRWGGDLSWEWGFVHPDDARVPWSVVFVRISDGGRHRILSTGALVWRGEQLARMFQNREVALTLTGVHRAAAPPLTIPKLARLLVPGAATGVPASVRVDAGDAGGGGDTLSIDFRTDSKARVALPSDVDPFKLVLLNESCGRATVSGRVQSQRFDFDGAAMMEFVRG